MEQPAQPAAVQECLREGTELTDRLHLLLPLASSIIYVTGAVLLKRAAVGGAGLWRSAFVSNLIGALFFLPLLALGGADQPVTRWWQPAVVALLLLAGQCASLWSLTRGDVSVATPVLGAKIILVALFTTLIARVDVPGRLWLAALLSTLGILLLHRSPGGRHHDPALTVLGALAAAAAFALFDVLVMTWSPAWGGGRFLPIMAGLAALYSLAFLPFFQPAVRLAPRSVWPVLLAGSALVSLQSLLLVGTVAFFGDATAVNIVYSTRGVWSVLLLWAGGSWLGAEAATRGTGALRWRLAGAGLMTAAVITVFA